MSAFVVPRMRRSNRSLLFSLRNRILTSVKLRGYRLSNGSGLSAARNQRSSR
jgi:hypothetical protein